MIRNPGDEVQKNEAQMQEVHLQGQHNLFFSSSPLLLFSSSPLLLISLSPCLLVSWSPGLLVGGPGHGTYVGKTGTPKNRQNRRVSIAFSS